MRMDLTNIPAQLDLISDHRISGKILLIAALNIITHRIFLYKMKPNTHFLDL
jgi:hypothetical protein